MPDGDRAYAAMPPIDPGSTHVASTGLAAHRSLRWRLPILIAALTGAMLATFLWAARHEVEAVLVQGGGERAQSVADQLANTLTASTQQGIESLNRLASEPAVRRYLERSKGNARDEPPASLTALAPATATRRIQIWNAAGALILELPRPSAPGQRTATTPPPAPAPPTAAGVGPIQAEHDLTFSDAVAEIRSEPATDEAGGVHLGYMLVRSTIAVNPPGLISRLVGDGAAVEIGNRAGGVWTDLSHVAPAPPVDLRRTGIATYQRADGTAHVGAMASIRGTPWSVWVEFPRQTILAPSKPFVTRMTALAAIFLLIGTAIFAVITVRITAPLRELSQAAVAIAAGDYSRQVSASRRDEIGRLGQAFNTMARQIDKDITERRRAEAALRESETRKTAVMNGALDCIITMDQYGVITEFNPAAERTFGYTRAEALGQQMSALLIPEAFRRQHEEGIERYARTGQGRILEKRLEMPALRKDGTEFTAELTVIATRTDGPPIFIGFLRDVTEQKLAESERLRGIELQEENARVLEANRLKSEFLANMSHELRTPLNAIIGFAELMHKGRAGELAEPHREYVGDILTSSKHLLQLINDILDLAKVEAGKIEFRPEVIDLDKLVGEVRDIVRGLAAGKRLQVTTSVDPEVAQVTLDPARVKQILYNYLSNAIKFTPKGGRIGIEIRPEGPTLFRIDVSDTGIGIPADALGRLFVEFQQLDASAAKTHQGTGLGLALTKRIVEAHGGQVAVRSTPGHGSTFSAILPRVMSSGADEPQDLPLPPAFGTANPRTVLVIEDDPRDRVWLVRTLAHAGYGVETASSGADGIAKCERRRFDAITLDLLLPDSHGWEVLARIRSSGLNRDVPVIAVSISTEGTDAAGFRLHDYLVKPVTSGDLLTSLSRAAIHEPQPSVLLVDDDPSALKIAAASLVQLGYRLVCKKSAEEALRDAALDPPALVIVDLLMPGMDGFEFVARFRQTPTGRDVPIIVWTVKDLEASERRRLHSSMAAVVSKASGGTTTLVDELRRLMPLSRSTESVHGR